MTTSSNSSIRDTPLHLTTLVFPLYLTFQTLLQSTVVLLSLRILLTRLNTLLQPQLLTTRIPVLSTSPMITVLPMQQLVQSMVQKGRTTLETNSQQLKTMSRSIG